MFWSLTFLLFILKDKKIRKSIVDIVKILFSKGIVKPFILIMIYSGLLLLIFSKFKIKEHIDLKEVSIWILFSGVPLCYGAASKVPDKNYFRGIISNNIKFIIFIEFIISTFTFSLITEFLILLLFTLLFVLEAVSGMKKEHKEANKVISFILAIAGFFVLYKSFSLAIKNYKELNSIKVLVSLLTPIILSILYLPIIFLFGIWFNYDDIFFRLRTGLKYKFKVIKNNTRKNKRKDYKYRIEKIDDISTSVAKRKSIILILEEQYNLKDIENICMEQLSRYNYKNDAVCIYIATNDENYIISNWIVQAQWISPKLDRKFSPTEIGGVIRDSINFKYNKSYYKQEEYYRKNIFKDDKSLFMSNMKLYDEVSTVYNMMLENFEKKDWDKFFNICKQYEDYINDVGYRYGDMGISKCIDFDGYLQEFQNYIALIRNVILYTLDGTREFKNKMYLIKSGMEKLNKIKFKIENKRFYWMNKLNITIGEYN